MCVCVCTLLCFVFDCSIEWELRLPIAPPSHKSSIGNQCRATAPFYFQPKWAFGRRAHTQQNTEHPMKRWDAFDVHLSPWSLWWSVLEINSAEINFNPKTNYPLPSSQKLSRLRPSERETGAASLLNWSSKILLLKPVNHDDANKQSISDR